MSAPVRGRSDVGAAEHARPIFVLGIYPRSGTNHLLNLLCVHPDCAAASPIWEDFLLMHEPMLEAYVEAVTAHWNPAWGVGPEDREALLAALGDGILGFLEAHCDAPRVVTKTPHVDQLTQFATLFPRASLLVLVRDGRAVVESGVRSFGWFRDGAIQGWADAARVIADFDSSTRDRMPRYRIVRHEDLVERPEPTLRSLLEFLDLDAERYDFERAAALPLRGSSTLRRSRRDRIHWQAVPRSPDFDSTGRFRHWSRWRHARFNHVAGEALRRLGYVPVETRGGPVEAAWNALLDLCAGAVAVLRPALHAWRRQRARRRGAASASRPSARRMAAR